MAWEYSVSLDATAPLDLLRQLAARSRDLTPAMEQIGAMLQTSTDLRFEKEVDPEGRPWTPLAPATVKRKAKAGRERMLQWSGRLRGSIWRRADRTGVSLSTNLPYASAQQGGASIDRASQSREILRRFIETKTANGVVRELQPGFVKRSKANFVSWHEVPAHSINIPARPFLGINAQDRLAAIAVLQRFVVGNA